MYRTPCALALAALFVAVPALADDTAAIARIEANLPPRVAVQGVPLAARSLADEMRRLKVPGVSVAVIRGGKLAWARGYGVTREGGPAVTPQTLFQAASLSKSVTGLAAMRMAEQGKLDLDADVNTQLGAWKLPPGPGAGKASVRQLLSHTAGTTVSGFPGYPAGSPVPSVTQILDGAAPANTAPVRMQTAPGSAWAYSGGGYTVVQLAMAERAGKPFEKLVDELVFQPLGMRDSSFLHPLPASLAPRAAQPHERSGKAYAEGPFVHPELAAAGMWTTPSDMARFAIGVQDALAGRAKGLLPAQQARAMLVPVQRDYALGFGIDGKGQAFGHTGSNKGFQSAMLALTEGGDGAIVMTNSDAGGELAAGLIRAIAVEYKWPVRQPQVRSTIALAPELRKSLVGRYDAEGLGGFEISERDGQLMVSSRGGPLEPLYAESDKLLFTAGTRAVELHASDADSGKIIGGPVPFNYRRLAP